MANSSAVIPDNLIVVGDDIGLVPAPENGDAGKILTVNNDLEPEWATPSEGTQYTPGNGIEISDQNEISIDSNVVAEKSELATVATTGDYDDLLDKPDLSVYAETSNLATVATTGDYDDLINKPSIPAAQVNSDWNAASGVAQILNKPSLATVATSGSYTDLTDKPSIPSAYSASTGIDITSNVISADIDNSTIKTALAPSAIQSVRNLINISTVYGVFEINSDVKAKLTQSSSASGSKLKIHIPGNMFRYEGNVASDNVYVELCSDQYFNPGNNTALYPVAISVTYNSQQQKTYIDEQDVEISCYMADWLSGSYTLSPTSLNPASSSASSHWYMGFFRMTGTVTSTQAYAASSGSLPPDYAVVISEYVAGNKLCVANPIPSATSGDNGKLLGVTDTSGTLGWVSQKADELPSITGNADKVLKVNSGATGVEWASQVTLSTLNTAGITDIQQVAALPANPVATVLYLIPET